MITVTMIKDVGAEHCSARLPRRLINRCAQSVGKVMKEKKSREVSVVVVSEKKIRALNRIYRKKDKVTDVLSFGSEKGDVYLGDIFLCWKQLQRQAIEHRHSLSKECAILTVHGLFHLYGYDHEIEREALVMESLESRALRAL